MTNPKLPRLLIISSPSGAGKTTLARRIMAKIPEYEVSVSHTTRKPRPGEEDGREYYFVSRAEFDRMVAWSSFVEWADVHTSRYGTSQQELIRIWAARRYPLFDIDWQGTQRVLRRYDKALSVFILPPTMDELAKRLRGRKTDDDAEIRVRLGNAARELTHYDLYDHLVVNDDVDAAFEDLLAIVEGRPTPRPAPSYLDVRRLIDEVTV